jgi:hypothetical protein
MEEYECAGFCPNNQASSLWRLSVEDGKASGVVREAGIPTSGLEVQGASVADGTWHHIGFVRDSGANKARIYVDGALSASADLTSDSDGALSNDDGEDDPVIIGAHIIGGTSNLEQFFSGSIDEVGFYGVALSAQEMAALAALAPKGQGLDAVDAPSTPPSAAPSTPPSVAPSTATSVAPSTAMSDAPPAATTRSTLPNTTTDSNVRATGDAAPGMGLIVMLGLAGIVIAAVIGLVGRTRRRSQR